MRPRRRVDSGILLVHGTLPRCCSTGPATGLRVVEVGRDHIGRSGASVHQSIAKSAAVSAQVVRMPRLQARPLSHRTSIDTEVLLVFGPMRPAGRRVLPFLLPPVDSYIEQPTAVVH